MPSGVALRLAKALRAPVVLALLFAAAGARAWYVGPDVNWDLKNYHLYAAFALLEWRYDLDLVPAGLQSYFNPLLDVPYYIVARGWGILPAALMLAAFYAVLVFLAWRLNLALFRTAPFDAWHTSPRVRLLLPLAATALGVTGAAAVSQIGTTFNEMQIAMLVIGGLLALVRHWDGVAPSRNRAIGAGLLFGAAAALKLTAATFAPALVLATLIAAGWRKGVVAGFWICVGWGIAFSALFGWWGAILYARFENPVFPFYNAIFRSPWFPPLSFHDDRFLPTSAQEWLAYPLNWAFESSTDVTEVPLTDPRMALGLLALLVIGALRTAGVRLAPPAVFAIAFLTIGYLTWLYLFSILRYAIPLEVLFGTATAMAGALLTRIPAARGARLPAAGIVLAAFLVFQGTSYPGWGNTDFKQPFHVVTGAKVPDGSLVIMQGQPVGYIIPYVEGRDLRFLGVNNLNIFSQGYRLFDATVAMIEEHQGPRVMIRRLVDPMPVYLGALGLTLALETCQPVENSYEYGPSDISLCDVVRTTR